MTAPQGANPPPTGVRPTRGRDGLFTLGRVFGVRISFHVSWLLIFALVVVSLSRIPLTGSDGQLGFGPGFVVAILFFASLLVHELAHALVARRRGVAVEEVRLFIFGGTAGVAPDVKDARTEALVGIAGPLASGLLGGLFLALALLVPDSPATAPWGLIVLWLGASNLILAVANLVPGFPMDGGRLVRAWVWARTGDQLRATRAATLGGRAFGYLLMGIGVAVAIGGGSEGALNGIWLALVGFFLRGAAETSYRRIAVEKLVEGILVEDVMDHDVSVVNPNLTLDTLVDQHILAGQVNLYPVTVDGDLVGTVHLGQVRKVPRSAWPSTRVTDVMSRGDRLVTITRLAPLWQAITGFEQTGLAAIPVVDEETRRRLLGLVTRDGVFRALRARATPGT